jgi:hypothetical protein
MTTTITNKSTGYSAKITAKGGRPKKGVYGSTFHKDGSVTVWDCHNQGWIRTSNPSDRLLSTLSNDEREKVISHTGVWHCQ